MTYARSLPPILLAKRLPHSGRDATNIVMNRLPLCRDSAVERRSKTVTRLKTLLAGAAVLSAMVASSASAAVIITPFTGGPFSLSNPLGTLPATKMTTGNTYDYTFSLAMPLGTGSSVQLAAQKLIKGSSVPELIQYSLYTGAPGSGTFVSQSSLDFAPTIAFTPTVGSYYVQVNYIAVSGEVAGGTITSSVPEPASWAMMLVGFGALGVALRRRAAKTGPIAV